MAIKKAASQDALKSQAEFAKTLASGSFAPVYLFEGKEEYLREQSLNQLVAAAVDQSLRDFNVTEIALTKGNLDDALAVAQQFPMMSPRRAVIVTEFENLTDESQLELLKDYLRNPVESTVLIFNTAGMDNRRNIATILRKFAAIVSFEALDERDAAPRWIMNYVADTDSSIDAGTASYLIGMVGTDLQQLTTELDKLITYVGPRGRITRQEVDLLVRYSHEHTNFELPDALLEGNRKRALNVLNHIFENARDKQGLALMLLGAIARTYRNLLLSKDLMRQNAPNSEIAKAVGMPPFAVTNLNEKARKMELAQILTAIERIAAMDVALKSSLGTPRLQLELLICELCPR